MTILVTVPVWRTRQDLFDACVNSLLRQTHTDICLLLLGDGESPSLRFIDSRIVVHTLPDNRGRYFADAAAQRATPFEWYAPHDSDDWSEPRRLADLWSRRKSGNGVVWSDYMNHIGPGSPSRMQFPRATRPLPPQQSRQACHLGLYRIDRVRATGMYHPDFRVHYDTLHNSLIKMTCGGEIAYSPYAMYHRMRWSGSMTRNPQKGMGTPYRKAAARRTQELYGRAWELYRAGLSDRIAEMITSTIDRGTLDAVESQAEELRAKLT